MKQRIMPQAAALALTILTSLSANAWVFPSKYLCENHDVIKIAKHPTKSSYYTYEEYRPDGTAIAYVFDLYPAAPSKGSVRNITKSYEVIKTIWSNDKENLIEISDDRGNLMPCKRIANDN